MMLRKRPKMVDEPAAQVRYAHLQHPNVESGRRAKSRKAPGRQGHDHIRPFNALTLQATVGNQAAARAIESTRRDNVAAKPFPTISRGLAIDVSPDGAARRAPGREPNIEVRIDRAANELEVTATLNGGTPMTGTNGHERDVLDLLGDGRNGPLLNAIQGSVPTPLRRSKLVCAEAHAVAEVLANTRGPRSRYRDIRVGPAKHIKGVFRGRGTSMKYFPVGSNYQRCENCQQWLEGPDFDRIVDFGR